MAEEMVERAARALHAEMVSDDGERWVNDFDENIHVGNFWRRIAATVLEAAHAPDTEAIDQLVDFVRTPEWSVSMLEDIAVIVQKARPDVFKKDGWSYDADDPRAWRRH